MRAFEEAHIEEKSEEYTKGFRDGSLSMTTQILDELIFRLRAEVPITEVMFINVVEKIAKEMKEGKRYV